MNETVLITNISVGLDALKLLLSDIAQLITVKRRKKTKIYDSAEKTTFEKKYVPSRQLAIYIILFTENSLL